MASLATLLQSEKDVSKSNNDEKHSNGYDSLDMDS
jgi:hypothetical protein